MGTDLGSLEVLTVDCQTTAATPAGGSIIELAWSTVTAAEPDRPVTCFTLRLPPGGSVPARISAITGITDADLTDGIEPAEAWWLLGAALRAPGGGWRTPVAHYGRFEKLWLEDLRNRTDPGGDLPLHIVCTREIARRLYPDIPRKGLRALSGYLGRTIPEMKRAADHVRATSFVWGTMVPELESLGIGSVDSLGEWLREPPPKKGRHRYSLPREARLGLPEAPGVYRFLGADSRVLYVGKATSLRQRVSSYFTKRKADEKTLELVTQVHGLRATPCGSPLEAALLECRLIRRLRPPYNRALKSGDESLWFCSCDARSWSTRPGPGYPLGPYPAREVHGRLAWLAGALEPGALEEGISMALDEFSARGLASSRQRVFAFGRELWQEMRRRRDESGGEGEEEAEDGDGAGAVPEEGLCSADDVRSRVMWTVAEAALLERRLRWFRLLAWSTVTWSPVFEGSGESRFVVLRNGGVAGSGSGPPGPHVPPPLRPGIPVLTRSGYELLRVLTTEIRRLSSAETDVTVHLPTGRTLSGERLASLLRMV
jgi:hypothetical protein